MMDTSAIQKCINHIRYEDTKYSDELAHLAEAQLSALLVRLEEAQRVIEPIVDNVEEMMQQGISDEAYVGVKERDLRAAYEWMKKE